MKAGILAALMVSSLAHPVALALAEGQSPGHESSLKIDDDQLSELTAPEVATDLRTIDYADRDSEEAASGEGESGPRANSLKKNLEFRREIAKLKRSLSELNERYRSLLRRRQRRDAVSREDIALGEGYAPAMAYVLDSNPALDLVVLSVGAEEGVRPGLVYRVVRERRVVARLRVLLLRERICAAQVLEEGREDFPGVGDEAVLGQPGK